MLNKIEHYCTYEQEDLEYNKKIRINQSSLIFIGSSGISLKFKEKPKVQEDDENKFQHIKSEIVWNAVEFENKNRKDKFLRLLGAKKHKNSEIKEDKELTEKLKQDYKKLESDLASQFDMSRRR